MVSLSKGVLKFKSDAYERAKYFYEVLFLIHMVVVFAFYNTKMVAPVFGIGLFVAALIVQFERNRNSVMIPFNTVWYFVLILFGALSGMWAQFFTSYNVAFLVRLVVIMLICASISIYVDDMEDLDRILSMFIAASVIIVLLEFTAVPSEGWKNGGVGRYFSGINPNDITVWIDFATAAAFYRAYVNEKRWMYIVVALFIVFCSFSGSRKGLLAAVAAPLLIVVLSTHKNGYALRVIAAVLLVAGLFLLVMENETLYSAIGKRLERMFDTFKGEDSDGSIRMRQHYIDVAKDMFRQSPIIGKGMGNYSRILESEYASGNFYSHNNYWQILSEMGMIGALIYFSMYVYCLISFIRGYFIQKRKIAILFLTAILMMIVLDTGIVSYCTKYGQMIITLCYCGTYAMKTDGGRRYRYEKA